MIRLNKYKKMIKCLQCGKCCYKLVKGKLEKCKFLIKLKEGKTICRIYNNRLGTETGHKSVCIERKDSPFNYKNCPFNILSPKKPMIEEVLKNEI